MQNSINEIKLHDIKPLMEIQEYSIYYFWAIIIVCILLFLGISYLIVRYIKNKNTFSLRKEHYKLLSKVNFKDAKQSAYDITFYGATFKDDTSRHLEVYENMLKKLEEYKYKKSVSNMQNDIKNYVEHYRDMIDV